MRIAIIDDVTNKVENVEVHDSLPVIENKTCIASDIAGIGDDYDGIDFIKPVIFKTQAELDEDVKNIWFSEMSSTDIELPRYIEDIIDTMSATQLGKLAAPTKTKHDAKKAKRQEGIDNGYI